MNLRSSSVLNLIFPSCAIILQKAHYDLETDIKKCAENIQTVDKKFKEEISKLSESNKKILKSYKDRSVNCSLIKEYPKAYDCIAKVRIYIIFQFLSFTNFLA